MVVETHGIQTKVNCANPQSTDLKFDGTTYTLTSTSDQYCTAGAVFSAATADQQYGVTNVPNCGTTTTNVEFQAVMFWYFHKDQLTGRPLVQSIFCQPIITAFNVRATASLNNGTLINVTSIDTYTRANNVTGAPQNSQAFNGYAQCLRRFTFFFTEALPSRVVFNNSTNTFVQARATATRSGVPGAIFRFASQQPNGPGSVFENGGFLDITRRVYVRPFLACFSLLPEAELDVLQTQHLSIVAKSVYFVPIEEEIPSSMTYQESRLIVECVLFWTPAFLPFYRAFNRKLSGHALAATLVLIALAGLAVQILHSRARRELYLTSFPGTIASIVSLTSRSGFGDLLVPYDTDTTLKKKLEGIRFRLDKRTGAVLADDDIESAEFVDGSRDAAMMSLLGQRHEQGYLRQDPYARQEQGAVDPKNYAASSELTLAGQGLFPSPTPTPLQEGFIDYSKPTKPLEPLRSPWDQ